MTPLHVPRSRPAFGELHPVAKAIVVVLGLLVVFVVLAVAAAIVAALLIVLGWLCHGVASAWS
ncbi:hypothetical protein [Actinoplanes sp. NPDC049118]|uniref:hypothetical protein n=1 Tax=Actinoplanes sp. NPDC049118 TaxID=3155769 RepID=UPI0033E39DDE